jgi:hypothetical protein
MKLRHLSFAFMLTLFACGRVETPTAEQGLQLKAHDEKLVKCRAQGREAGTYQAYADCKKDAGIE